MHLPKLHVRGLFRTTRTDRRDRTEEVRPELPAPPPTRHLLKIDGPTVDEITTRYLAEGKHGDPHTVLGAHALGDGRTAIRTMIPGRDQVVLAYDTGTTTKRVPMQAAGHGVFEMILDGTDVPAHHFEVLGKSGRTQRIANPYVFAPTISEMDRWLFNEGSLRDVASVMGANQKTIDGVDGVSFTTWAPNAQGIAVTGDFDDWDAGRHSMRRLGDSGIWEIFVPGAEAGQRYKYRVVDKNGDVRWKSDPFGQASGLRPDTCSVVAKSSFEWNDDAWMTKRASFDHANAPVSVYELHLSSWRQRDHHSFENIDDVERALYEIPKERLLNYREIADLLVPWLQDHGFTHVELLGLLEHPLDSSWGYQVAGYYTPTARHGSPDDLKYLVDKLHAADIGVIVDWVPGHFPKDDAGIARFDGTNLFDHEDDRLGEQRDWNTRCYNYGRNEVRTFLHGSLDHMLSDFHFDGVRVDGVASMLYRDYSRGDDWIPNEHGGNENLEAIDFLRDANKKVGARYPGVMKIAEESTSFPNVTGASDDGLNFDYKWNMGWMNDTLRFFERHPSDRGGSLDDLSNTFLWAHSERFVCSLAHDEVVHGKGSLLNKMPGEHETKLANLRLLYGFMWAYPGHKLLFMGSEHATPEEWDFRRGLCVDHLSDGERGIQRLIGDLNRLYRDEPALHVGQFDPGTFESTFRDYDNAVLGMRRGGDEQMLFVHNAGENAHQTYRIGVDQPGDYEIVLSTDDPKYGGKTPTPTDAVTAEAEPSHGKPYSIEVELPAFTTLVVRAP